MAVRPGTLTAERVRPPVLADLLPGARVRDALLVVGYAALVGLTAQVVLRLPFTPVPITGQTFGVLLGGMAVGWRRAGLGMALYLLAGLGGLPWFAAGSGGWAVAASPTIGYLVAFVVAGPAVGWLAGHRADRHPAATVLAMAVGTALIYGGGVTGLMITLHLDLSRAVVLGVLPFLVGDTLKAVMAAILLPGAWRLSGRR
ncbi:MAG TPA: biotin transporter BioY [Candidatus Dormibacteraeota bacterium]|nr:biotin transporter BioY [Candidatus Dormibacteraeota bacterium]